MAERIEVIIDGNSVGYIRAAGAAEAATRRLQASNVSTSRAVQAFNAVGAQQVRNLQAIGRAARFAGTVASGVLVLGIYQAVRAGAEFEQQMARVQAVSQASGREMQMLREQAKQLGADTKFSAGEAAEAMYELSSAGFSVAEMRKAVPGTLDLAAASSIDLASAAEISSNALRGFGLEAKQSTHVADVLAQSVNASSVEMTDLQLTMKYIGPVAKATGQSLEEMVAAVSIMGDAGIKGEQAGTTLRGAMTRLIHPVGQAEKALRQMGLSAKDLHGPDGLLPLPELIGVLQKATEDMTVAERNAAFSRLFGAEALSGMLTVIDAGPAKLAKLTKEFENSDGASRKAAKTMNDTVIGAFDELTGSLETVEISLFEKFEDPLAQALRQGARFVNREGKQITDWLSEIVETPEFRAADIEGKVKILARAISDELIDTFNDASPQIAEMAGELAIDVAEEFVRTFTQTNVIGKAFLGGVLISKLGLGPVIFRRAGVEAAREFTQGMATGNVGAAATGAATAFAAGGAGAGRKFGREWKSSASGVILPAGVEIGRQAAARTSEGMQSGFKARAKGLGQTMLGIGRGILGVNAALGLVSGITSEAPTIEGRIQDMFSNFSLGLIPSWAEEAEKAGAEMAAGLQHGMEMTFKEGGTTAPFGPLGPIAEIFDISVGAKETTKDLSALMRTLDDTTNSYKVARRQTAAWREALKQARDEGRISEDTYRELSRSINQAWRGFDRGKRSAQDIREDIRRTRITFADNLGQIMKSTEQNMRAIERSFGTHSKQGRQLVTANFNAAVAAIKKANREGYISTDKAYEKIKELIRKRLKMQGITGPDAEKILNATNKDGSTNPGGKARGGFVRAYARGGMARVPGYGLGDTVPLAVNGAVQARVAPGEDLMVANRHQRPLLDQAVAMAYGVDGMQGFFRQFDTPHYAAGPGFARGGMVDPSWDPGSEQLAASISSKVGAWAKRYGANMTAGYNPGGPHKSPGHNVTGTATDMVPLNPSDSGWDRLEEGLKVLVRQGLTVYYGTHGVGTPLDNHGRYNHAHIEWGDASGVSGLGGFGRIKLPRFESPFPGFAPHAQELNIAAAALEKEMTQRLRAFSGVHGPMAKVGGGVLSEAEFIRIALTALEMTKHFPATLANAKKLLILAKQESSLDPNSINNWDSNAAAGNPSGGLMHTTVETFRRYHEPGTANTYFDPLASIAASINYQKAEYGALVTHSPYARGGILDLFASGGVAAGGKGKGKGKGGKDKDEGRTVVGPGGNVGPDTDLFILSKPLREKIKMHREQVKRVDEMIAELTTQYAMHTSEAGTELGPAERARMIWANEDVLLHYMRGLAKLLRKGIRQLPRGNQTRKRLSQELHELAGETGEGGRILEVTAEIDRLKHEGLEDVPEVDNEQLIADLKESARLAIRKAMLADAQFKVMTDFFREGAEGMPFLGAFMTGTGGRRVGQTGLAVLHRDEQVVPDPKGPAGSQLAGRTIGGDGVTVQLVMRDRAGELVELVDARVDGRLANVETRFDRSIGKRARVRAAAPGR